jgi:hypothetical protein
MRGTCEIGVVYEADNPFPIFFVNKVPFCGHEVASSEIFPARSLRCAASYYPGASAVQATYGSNT